MLLSTLTLEIKYNTEFGAIIFSKDCWPVRLWNTPSLLPSTVTELQAHSTTSILHVDLGIPTQFFMHAQKAPHLLRHLPSTTLVFETGAPTRTWACRLSWLGCLASEPQRFTSLPLPNTGFTGTCHHTCLFIWLLGIQFWSFCL